MTGRPSGRRTHICPPEHTHGKTSTCYGSHSCGCPDCRAGCALRAANRARDLAYGRYDNGMTDATPAREHVIELMRFGIPFNRIAVITGKSSRWLSEQVYGHAGKLPKSMSQGNAALLLAVPLDPALRAPTGLIHVQGARRRLQALVTLGWSLSRLQVEAGHTEPGYHYYADLVRTARSVTVALDTEIRELYARLWTQHPTFSNGLQASMGRRVARRAIDQGWARPLQWDDIDNDPTPAEADGFDTIDEVAVELAVRGERVRLNHAEKVEGLRLMHPLKWSNTRIADHLGCDERTVNRLRVEINLPGWDQNDVTDRRAA